MTVAEGEHSLLDVADRSGMPFRLLHEAAGSAAATGLVRDA